MKLVIRLSRVSEAAYVAWCPALPGCSVRANSRDEAHHRIRDAVTGYLASLDVALPRELDNKLQAEMSYAVA